MSLRVGFLGIAHLHAWGYAASLRKVEGAEPGLVYDHLPERARKFADLTELQAADAEAVLASSDAIVICSENKRHAKYVEIAAAAGKPILCEKPLVTSEDEAARIQAAVEKHGVQLMTAFPCRYAPAYERLLERFRADEIGKLVAVCATNRGQCPFDWFVDVNESGGGAMIDHVVHVADLLRVLLGEEVKSVYAQVGSNMHGQDWEDTAMLTLEFPSGVFATLDSSWSRPKSYKTWGDVTMNVVGEGGVLEMDMFSQAVHVYKDVNMRYGLHGYGSDLDLALVSDFNQAARSGGPMPITLQDGLQAARVALAGYASVQAQQPVAA